MYTKKDKFYKLCDVQGTCTVLYEGNDYQDVIYYAFRRIRTDPDSRLCLITSDQNGMLLKFELEKEPKTEKKGN